MHGELTPACLPACLSLWACCSQAQSENVPHVLVGSTIGADGIGSDWLQVMHTLAG